MGTSIALACILSFGLTGGQSAPKPEWKRYALADGLVASFPALPRDEKFEANGKTIHRYTAMFETGLYRLAPYPNSEAQARDVEAALQDSSIVASIRPLLDSALASFATKLKGKVSDLQFGGYKGNLMERGRIDMTQMVGYVAIIASPKHILCLLAVQPRGRVDLLRIQRFFDSVEIEN